MKKYIISACALAIGSLAFGQVTVDPPGPAQGTSATATVIAANPLAGPGANAGLSIQNGDDNRVKVRQAGTSQSVYTNQNNGTSTGGNLARIMQTGDVSGLSGVENAAEVLQSGALNQSTTKQEGDNNDAVTWQGQNNLNSNRNKAYIRQGVAQQAEDNSAVVEQDGRLNEATIQQTWDNSDAWTRQRGAENKSMILQNASPENSAGHEAWNRQVGDRNESFISQEGAGARNVASANQKGDDNQAKQAQTTSSPFFFGNNASIEQGELRSDNVPFLDLVTTIDPLNQLDFKAAPFNEVSVGAGAKQTQSGTLQNAEIVQWGGAVGDSNYAEQEQSGSTNNAGIFQNHEGVGGDNYAKQDQAGFLNFAAIGQEGFGNKALQTQTGVFNIAGSVQEGDHNLLNIHQFGNANVAISTQIGSHNAGLIVQGGGQSYTLEQGLIGPSTGNQADILQLGPNGNFDNPLIPGCYFDPQMDLNMDYTVPDFELEDVCPDC